MGKYNVLNYAYLKSECGQFFAVSGIEKLLQDDVLRSIFNIKNLKIQCINKNKKIEYKEILNIKKINKKLKTINIKTESGKNEDFVYSKFNTLNNKSKISSGSILLSVLKSNFGKFNAGSFIPSIAACFFASRFCINKNINISEEISEIALNKLSNYLIKTKSGLLEDIDKESGDYKVQSLECMNNTINIGMPLIFSWKDESLRHFMRDLYSICGYYIISKNEDGNLYNICMHVKEGVISDRIIDILGKFNIRSQKILSKNIRTEEIFYKIEINENSQVLKFLSDIGFNCNKQIELIKIIAEEKKEFNDLKFVPSEYWDIINKNNLIKYDFSEIDGQDISMESLRKIGEIINSEEVINMSNSDLVFDKVIYVNEFESKDNIYEIEIEDGFNPVVNGVVI